MLGPLHHPAILVAMWLGGVFLVWAYLLAIADGQRIGGAFLAVGAWLAAIASVALAEEVADARHAKAGSSPRTSQKALPAAAG